MSTLVLARKYRPRNFAQMVGQEHVVRALTHAIEQRRLHHAYLFTGTRGIGKTTVSRILAKCLNCTGVDGTGGITAEPCGACSACTQIDADRYIDYIELDAASNRGIDDARDLIERAAYKPSVGRYKVFMIDEAHQLTKDAFNALLKTLEEPPEHLKFVLATTDPDKMLPTVLSRCLQFNLRPMAPEVVRSHLEQVLTNEDVAFDDNALRLLARAARGSMRDALSLTDQAISYGGGFLEAAAVRAMLGAVDDAVPLELALALARRDGPALLEVIARLHEAGLSASSTLEQIGQLLQRTAVEQAVPGALGEEDPLAAAARELAPLLAPDETQLLYSIVLHGRQELGLMSDENAAFTMVLLRYLAFPPAGAGAAAAPVRAAPLRAPAPPAIAVAAPAGTAARGAAGEASGGTPGGAPRAAVGRAAGGAAGRTGGGTVGTSGAGPSGAEAMALPVSDPALGDRWLVAVKPLADAGAITGLVRELAWQGQLVAIEPGPPAVWRLLVEHDALRAPGLRDKLAEALGASLSQTLRLEVDLGRPTDTPAHREAAERARRQQAAEAIILADPDVRALLDQFKTARIVPGSIKPT